jgi:hypothetical protein
VPWSSLPTNNHAFLLCKALHNRNYAELSIMRSLKAVRGRACIFGVGCLS